MEAKENNFGEDLSVKEMAQSLKVSESEVILASNIKQYVSIHNDYINGVKLEDKLYDPLYSVEDEVEINGFRYN